jgi:hypothetical protein
MLIGERLEGLARQNVDDGDVRLSDHRALRIGDQAIHGAGIDLSNGCRREGEQQ